MEKKIYFNYTLLEDYAKKYFEVSPNRELEFPVWFIRMANMDNKGRDLTKLFNSIFASEEERSIYGVSINEAFFIRNVLQVEEDRCPDEIMMVLPMRFKGFDLSSPKKLASFIFKKLCEVYPESFDSSNFKVAKQDVLDILAER